MKKRVLIFSREYPPVIVGGTAMVARSAAEGLRNLGYDVTVVTSIQRKESMTERRDNIQIVGIPGDIYEDHSGLETHNLRYHKTVIDYLRKTIIDKPHIVLMPDLFSYPEAYLYAKMNGIPLVNILLQDFIKMIVYDKQLTHKCRCQVIFYGFRSITFYTYVFPNMVLRCFNL